MITVLLICTIISILLTIGLLVVRKKCYRVEYVYQRSGNVNLPPNKKYITFSHSPGNFSLGEFPRASNIKKHTGVAGLGHVRMCIQNLIIIAKKTNRIAILFPLWLYLHRDHNKGRWLSLKAWWDRYYNLDDYISKGIVAPKNLVIHDHKHFLGKIRCPTKYVSPMMHWKDIKNDPEQLITMHFNGGHSEKSLTRCAAWDCAGAKIGGGIGHGWQREVKKIPIPVSKHIENVTKQCVAEIGKKFVILHIRRGDIIVAGSYWNMKAETIDHITSSPQLIKFLQKRGWDDKTNILIVTNEKNNNHFDELKNTFPNTKLESELSTLTNLDKKMEDNFFTYLVLMELCNYAEACYSTAHCYFSKPCVGSLKDDVPKADLEK